MRKRRYNKRILILCEGQTEYLYAKSLQMALPRDQQRSVSIEIDFDTENDPLKLVKAARRRKQKAKKEQNSYDDIWLFFDHDNWPQLPDAFAMIDQEGFRIAYSAICLEHWFILHFEDCGRAFVDGKEAERYLKKHWPTYHKTKIKHFAILEDRLEVARERAVLIRKRVVPDKEVFEQNPYTTVDHLIDYFEKLT